MAYSPRKVPLSGGLDIAAGSSTTRRAYFCSVVVEGSEKGRLQSQDVQDLVASLGEPLTAEGSSNTTVITRSSSAPSVSSSMSLDALAAGRPPRKRSLTDGSALQDVIKELVTTERSYVNRLRILKQSYADPLRSFARSRDTAIIPAYEAKTLFGNIDAILVVNENFLLDLDKMMAPNGAKTVGGVGDITLKHFRDLKAFDCYKQYYAKREEAQGIFEREMMKKQGFANFIERIKYSTADVKSRVGLRELLMDPVQRIPRYTMMFGMMINYMSTVDPQRAKLVEANELASKIALCEVDDPTKRATTMYCLERTVEGFPPSLISNSRRFIDCIDVEDIPVDGMQSSSSSGAAGLASSSSAAYAHLHCTLFLFDDTLMIVKRQAAGSSGRALAGLDDLERMTKIAAAGSRNKVKTTMSCKGVVDVLDVVATDPGASDIHTFLEKPPQDQTDRWSGRPFRSLSVVHPPAPINFDPTLTQADKQRFLNNLWTAQANYRARQSRSVVLCMPEREVEARSGKATFVKTYFNVYHRMAYLGEPKKGKIVLHIDPTGEADPLPFGVDCGPYVMVRVHPIPGDLCRYKVTSRDPNDPGEEDIVSSASISSRIIQTIHQYRLFKFRAGVDSAPATPTHSNTARSRTGMFGLDSVSRNLFNTRPGSVMGDVFGTISSNHKRTRSAASSRASTQTTTTTSSFKFSSRSTSTAPTSILEDDEEDESPSRSSPSRSSPSRVRSLRKRALSPSSGSDGDRKSPPKRKAVQMLESDWDGMDESEWNLSLRLELARNNSQKQDGAATLVSTVSEDSWQHVVLSPEPSQAVAPPKGTEKAPSVKTSSDSDSRPTSTTPTQELKSPPPPSQIPQRSRPTLRGPRKPVNSPPRATTPLPVETENMVAAPMEVQPIDLENLLADMTSANCDPSKIDMTPSTPPRIRIPLEPNTNYDPTPRPVPRAPPTVEPLSIKKKSSVHKGSPGTVRKQSLDSPTKAAPVRKQSLDSPSKTTPGRKQSLDSPTKSGSVRRGSQQARSGRRGSKSKHKLENLEDPSQLLIIAETTREDMHSSRRAVKRIKLEVDTLKATVSKQLAEKGKPDMLRESGLPRSPQSRHISNRAAEARMLEMRHLIEQGRTVASKPLVEQPKVGLDVKPGVDIAYLEEWSKNVEGLITDTDTGLKKAVTQHEDLEAKLRVLVADAREKTTELDKVRAEVEHVKKQCEVVKKFLEDSTTEKEIMYDAFNEELDGMFNDASLPETEAWQAMTQDLRKAKDARNRVQLENATLKRELEESKLQNEHWQGMLRKAGLL